MQRVMILGGSGSGKSTLARRLGAQTGLPVFHMDHIQWQAGWVSRTRDVRREMALEIENQDKWIFEGGFSTTYEHRAARADTLIWLDLPVGLRLWRVTKRLFRYWGQARPDMAEGCVEGFHSETLPFYIWIWQTRHSSRVRIQKLIEELGPDTKVVHLCRARAVRQYLAQV
ncbi:MAG: AAA family ATPase [Sulfitobacter sp.]